MKLWTSFHLLISILVGMNVRKYVGKKCPACQAKIRELGLKDTPKHSKENQLQTYFMSEVGKVINDRGRKMLGWDEMLEGGLAPGATVMSWTGVKGGIEAARLHHDAIMTPIQFLIQQSYLQSDKRD